MKTFSEETRRRMSEAAKRRCDPEWRKAKSESMRTPIDGEMLRSLYEGGMTQEEVAARMGVSQKVVYSAMKRLGIKARVAAKRDQTGPNNHSWKGSAAKYQALHLRVAVQRGTPSLCEGCGTSGSGVRYEWANMTGRYDDPMDYRRLCKSCHAKHDGVINNIPRMAGTTRRSGGGQSGSK